MVARIVTCLVIACDDCGETQDGDGGTPHFESVESARKHLADEDPFGWVIADNGAAK